MQIELIKSKKNRLIDIKVKILKDLSRVNKKIKNELINLGFKAKESEVCFYKKTLYVGTKSYKGEDLKIAVSNAIRKINETKYTNICINLANKNREFNLAELVEGLILGSYKFKKYKSKKVEKDLNVYINIKKSKYPFKELLEIFSKTKDICNSVNMARTIVNTSPEDYYPKKMAQNAKQIAKENNLECNIYGEKYLEENEMNAMLSVGRASRHESQLIHLIHKPKKSKGKIVLVGKGLTYDSGGLSLKPANSMISMKCDKSGGVAVLGIMKAIAKLDFDYEVHGIVGAVENMIGGNAYKPDDILTAKNKTTIEVRNTDAEGRLVLADCLCYAQDKIEDIDYIIDMATLTGACIIALGEYTTGAMGHSEKLKKMMLKAAKNSGELVGILPYNRYLPSMINSQIADITNSTTSKAGSAITASLFLDRFIQEKYKKKWLHLDIAGASYKEKAWGYNPYGGSGAGVRLILKFIENLSK